MNTLLQQAAQAFLFFALCFTSGSYVDLSGKLLQEAASEAALQIILMECLVWDTLSELCEKRFSPHLCVGFLFLILYPAASSSSASAASAFTLSHTIFHTQLCHTPSFTPPSFTHNFVTHHLSPHHLSRATLSHIIFHKQLCHTPSFTTPSFTRNFVTHTHNFVTRHLSHTTLSHTIFHHTIFHTQLQPWFCVAGAALAALAWLWWLCHTQQLCHRLVTDSLSHTTLPHTHNFVTLHLSHAPLSQTICHTPLVTHNFVTHNFVTHHLSHTHTPSFTHIWLSVDAVWSLIVLTDLQTVTFVAHAQR